MNKKTILRDLFRVMTGSYLLYTLTELIEGLALTAIAEKLGSLADRILSSGGSLPGSEIAILLTLIVCLSAGVPAMETLAETTMFRQSLPYCEKVWARFLTREPNSVIPYNVGDLEYRLEQDPIDFYVAGCRIFTSAVSFPLILGFLLYSSLRIHPLYALIAILLSWIRLGVPMLLEKKREKYDDENREGKTEVRSVEITFAEQLPSLVTLGIKDHWISLIRKRFDNYFEKVGARHVRLSVRYEAAKKTVSLLSELLIILIGALFAAMGSIPPGSIVAMAALLPVFELVNEKLFVIAEKKPEFGNLLKRMQDLYPQNENDGQICAPSFDTIEVNSVSYSYEENRDALKPLSFSVSRGEKILITGENGSGKSTLAQILLGFLPDYRGHILINGTELRSIAPASLRKRIGYVPQEPFIFNCSFKENVFLGRSESDFTIPAELEEALRLHLSDDRTVSSTSLSGGEMQKLAILRAALGNPELWIFDEPTNNLDEEAVNQLIDFLSSLHMSTLIITHDQRLIDGVRGARQVHLTCDVPNSPPHPGLD